MAGLLCLRDCLRGPFEASGGRKYFPPGDLRAVCLVRAIVISLSLGVRWVAVCCSGGDCFCGAPVVFRGVCVRLPWPGAKGGKLDSKKKRLAGGANLMKVSHSRLANSYVDYPDTKASRITTVLCDFT